MAHGKSVELREKSDLYEMTASNFFMASSDLPTTPDPGHRGPILTEKNKPKQVPNGKGGTVFRRRADRRRDFQLLATREQRLSVRKDRWFRWQKNSTLEAGR
jgi:hypothetical protein